MSHSAIEFGFVTNCLGKSTLEDAVRIAREVGLTCIEVGGSVPRDVADFERVIYQNDVRFQSLIYARNFLTSDGTQKRLYIQELDKLLEVAVTQGIPQITMSTGVMPHASLMQNIDATLDFWQPYFEEGAKANVRFALEFCPTSGNFALAPATWRTLFEATREIPNFGLNYDPSHLLWQMIDPYAPVEAFYPHIFSLHAKDTIIHRDILAEHGILTPYHYVVTAPHGVAEARAPWWDFRIPGEGELDWQRLLRPLIAHGYQGVIMIELEDNAYLGNQERVITGLKRSLDHLRASLTTLQNNP